MTSQPDSSVRPPASPGPQPENRPDERRARMAAYGSRFLPDGFGVAGADEYPFGFGELTADRGEAGGLSSAQ
jgi:hypothetical protein